MRIYTLAERPDLGWSRWRELNAEWPAFMNLAPTGVLAFGAAGIPEHALVGVAGATETVVARGCSVPFRLPRGADGSAVELPDDGWDEVIRWGAAARLTGEPLDTVSTLEVAVRSDVRGRGLGMRMLNALRENARRLGFATLVAPVRPAAKHAEPHVPMSEYVARSRDDGLPSDPWIRAHIRAGGSIVKVAPVSTVIAARLAQWREVTGLPFDQSGPIVVPGALVPVDVSVEHDYAVYAEPGLWVRHEL
jgi:GNAT superfamily N-acetyltransferase